jgi:integrase
MISYEAMIDKILRDCNSAPAKKLRSALPVTFNPKEIYEIDTSVVAGAPRGCRLDTLLQRVHARIAALDPEIGVSLRRVATYHYPKYNNILNADYYAADRTIAAASRWLNREFFDRPHHTDLTASKLAAGLIVASVIEMQVLSVNVIKGLLESVRDKRLIEFSRDLVSIPFPVAMRRGWPAQEGWANLKGCGLKILGRIKVLRKAPLWNAELGSISSLDTNQLTDALDAAISATCDAEGKFCLDQLMTAACALAIKHMPAAVRAVRCGVAISYAPELAAVRRITGKRLLPYPVRDSQPKADGLEDDTEEDDADGGKEPEWKTKLRAAVRKTGVDQAKLTELSQSEEPEGRLMAQYVIKLMVNDNRASTIYRYTGEIANKLVPCLGSQDPADLSLDEWEDLAERLLDEEAFFHDTVYSGSDDRNAAGYARPLIKALRSFIKCFWNHKAEAKEFDGVLPKTGYLHVNADMITVGEFRRALRGMHSWLVDGKQTYLVRTARVALILGFRLGLRIAELAFLRVKDFDVPVNHEDPALANLHLRVRPWLLRKLKTANADRNLPISVLIPPDELKEVLDYILDSFKCSGKTAPLFGQDNDRGRVMKFDRVVQILKSVFEGKPGARIHNDFHFHLLRHSAANLWLLKLWPGLHEVAQHVFAKDRETLLEIANGERFRLDLIETTDITGEDLQCCALLLGHGSAAVTIHHYLSVLWWWTGCANDDSSQPSSVLPTRKTY